MGVIGLQRVTLMSHDTKKIKNHYAKQNHYARPQ